MSRDPGDLLDKNVFLQRVVERLWRHPSDFLLARQRIMESQKTVLKRKAAGVLVPLLFRPVSSKNDGRGTFVFQLIKRSAYVPQPGDLSCPGGMVHPHLDALFRPLLLRVPLSAIHADVRRRLFHSGTAFQRTVSLFLTTALRESWEEIRLAPCNVNFLGPLPTYNLILFRRTIFPLVGFILDPQSAPRPNREVGKIIQIPLASFFQEGTHGCYTLSVPDPNRPGTPLSVQYPCLIHREQDGTEEILWGATFYILTQFLRIVADYRLPQWRSGRVVHRTLVPDYRTGKTLP